jgi:hypothetical protein
MPRDGNFHTQAPSTEVGAVHTMLNELGDQGWELAATAETGFLIFKRPKP